MLDHRAILKKLMLQEWDLLGENQTLSCVLDDDTSGYVKFTDAEKEEMRNIIDEAHVDWVVGSSSHDPEWGTPVAPAQSA